MEDEAYYRSNYNQTATQNMQQDPNVLRYKWDTENQHRLVENFLTGKIINTVLDKETGEVVEKEVIYCKERVNKNGQQALVAAYALLNQPQTLLANLDKDEYQNFLATLREDFANQLFDSYEEYELKSADFHPIVNTCMNNLRVELSHSRDGFNHKLSTQSVKIVEQSQNQQQKGLGSLFSMRR